MNLKLVKVSRTYLKDSVEKTTTDLAIELENGYRIPIRPKFDNKMDWRDLFMIAERAEPKGKAE